MRKQVSNQQLQLRPPRLHILSKVRCSSRNMIAQADITFADLSLFRRRRKVIRRIHLRARTLCHNGMGISSLDMPVPHRGTYYLSEQTQIRHTFRPVTHLIARLYRVAKGRVALQRLTCMSPRFRFILLAIRADITTGMDDARTIERQCDDFMSVRYGDDLTQRETPC